MNINERHTRLFGDEEMRSGARVQVREEEANRYASREDVQEKKRNDSFCAITLDQLAPAERTVAEDQTY